VNAPKRFEPETPAAAEEFFTQVYTLLRSRARRLLSSERRGHTLQPTALVHEAFMRLAGKQAQYLSRLHFLNAAALAMRRILIDHASAKRARKRRGIKQEMTFDIVAPGGDVLDVLALDEALNALAELSPRQAHVVNLRFFAGCTESEIARILRVSEPTVRRDWATARPWLYRFITSREGEPGPASCKET
jgi:RNA polymerase sigma factor (TIGR02999 family)